MRTFVGATGAAGIMTPTGLATDATTAPFFADTLSTERLYAFYDFENEAKIFADVHHRFRFAVTAITGAERTVAMEWLAFLTRHVPSPGAAVRAGRRRGADAQPEHRHPADLPYT